MKEPVARTARSEQYDVERRERRARASSGNKRERDNRCFPRILLCPSAGACERAQKRSRQSRRGDAAACRAACALVVSLCFTEKIRSGIFRSARGLASPLGSLARGSGSFVFYSGTAHG